MSIFTILLFIKFNLIQYNLVYMIIIWSFAVYGNCDYYFVIEWIYYII